MLMKNTRKNDDFKKYGSDFSSLLGIARAKEDEEFFLTFS